MGNSPLFLWCSSDFWCGFDDGVRCVCVFVCKFATTTNGTRKIKDCLNKRDSPLRSLSLGTRRQQMKAQPHTHSLTRTQSQHSIAYGLEVASNFPSSSWFRWLLCCFCFQVQSFILNLSWKVGSFSELFWQIHCGEMVERKKTTKKEEEFHSVDAAAASYVLAKAKMAGKLAVDPIHFVPLQFLFAHSPCFLPTFTLTH